MSTDHGPATGSRTSAAIASAPQIADTGARTLRGVGAPGYDSRARSLRFRIPVRYRVVWVALAALVLLSLATASAALNGDSLALVTALTGVLVVASLGQLLVIMLGGIDLSVPAVVTLAAGIVVHQTNGDDNLLAGAVALALAAGVSVGLLNGLLVAGLRLNALIVTLAVNGVVLGLLRLWMGATFSPTGTVPSELNDFAKGGIGWLSSIAIVAVVIAVTLAIGLRRTRVGRDLTAAGANPVAARVIGVRVRAYRVAVFALAGGLYAVAGVLLAGYLRTPDMTIGLPYQLQTVVAVALAGAALSGGPSSVTCTAGGAFFLVLLNQYLAIKGASAGISVLLQGVVLVAAVALVTGVTGTRWPMRAAWLPPPLRRGQKPTG